MSDTYRCDECGAEFEYQSHLRGHILGKHTRKNPLKGELHPNWKPIKHGTNAGYQKEVRLGQITCLACREARAKYMAKYKKGR